MEPVAVNDLHSEFQAVQIGSRLPEARRTVHGRCTFLKQISPSLLFLRLHCSSGPRLPPIQHTGDWISSQELFGSAALRVADESAGRCWDEVQLIGKVSDGFLTVSDISTLVATALGEALTVTGFPERVAQVWVNPSLLWPVAPVALHIVQARLSGCSVPAVLSLALPVCRPCGPASSGNHSRPVNDRRCAVFAEFLLRQFEPGVIAQGVLDVAGGSGMLAFDLWFRRGLRCTVVDPRAMRLGPRCVKALQYRDRIVDEHCPAVELHSIQKCFDEAFVHDGAEGELAWRECGCVVGMHPDQPTEDIVELALRDGKPFAVVPCCVFWKHQRAPRMLKQSVVKSYEQFCEYLQAKHPEIRRDILGFEGRNVVLYWTAALHHDDPTQVTPEAMTLNSVEVKSR